MKEAEVVVVVAFCTKASSLKYKQGELVFWEFANTLLLISLRNILARLLEFLD